MVLGATKRSGPERALREAIVAGRLVDLRTDQPRADGLARGAVWGRRRIVRSEVLAELLTQQGEGARRPRALRLAGARITGALDLTGLDLVCSVLLLDCWFDEPVILTEAQAVAVRLPGCHLPALQAERLTTQGNLELNLGFTVKGEVRLLGAHIEGNLDLSGATLTSPNGVAFYGDTLTVDQNMFCRTGFTAQGEVRLLGAHVGGQLNLNGATLTNPKGQALNTQGLTVDGSMLCANGFTAEGEIHLLGAHIGVQLDLSGATLTNPKGRALNAAGLIVDQSMVCTKGFTAHGEVQLLGARIKGVLDLSGATLNNLKGLALNAWGLTVEQSMLCLRPFTAEGLVLLVGAHVGGHLNLNGATLTNLKGRALSADALTVGQVMSCLEPFTAEGEVRLRGARIGAQLSFEGATLTNPDGVALDLQGMQTPVLLLRTKTAPSQIDLGHARVDALADDEATWPEKLRLRGFAYDALAERSVISAAARLGWLRLDPAGFTPQPYEQLVAVYRSAGREEDARKVAIGKQRARRGELGWPGKLWSLLLGALIGHGYRTWFAGLWLLAWLVAGTIIFDHAEMTSAKKPGDPVPAFSPFAYALDVLLPVADLNQQSSWIPQGFARLWMWASIVAGWVLTTAVVAALTGILKRD